jgi:membrane-bound serine protease (ClpP class)
MRMPRLIAALLMLAGLAGLAAGQSDDVRPVVVMTEIADPIGPPAAHRIGELIEEAEERGAVLAVLRLDTPGGLTTSTRDINRDILAAQVPVAVFVAPPGARAASAGTYILYASHLAAMAPGTNLGAATPVQMGGGGPSPGGDRPKDAPEGEEGDEGASETEPPGDALSRKSVNDAVAQIRSLAELRGRNADWAEKAVREAASLSAEAALKEDVIEIVADDLDDLLAQADGREIDLRGRTVTLDTADAQVVVLEPSLVTQLLTILANPNVALLLMTLGFYGLVFELANPGLGPGIPGAILLLLGLYSLNLLPVDYAGLALIGLGLALMAAEAVTPAFGILGLGGAVAFALGAAILIDTDLPQYQISPGVIIAASGLSLLIVTLVIGAVWRTRGAPERAGAKAMIGRPARVLDWEGGRGHVFAEGERWIARGPDRLEPGDQVEIASLEGLTLEVRRRDGGSDGRTPP